MRQQQRILRWQSANGKYSVGNAVVERIRSFRRLARNPAWWDLAWTSYIDKRLSLMCPAKIMAYNSPGTRIFLVIIHFENEVQGFRGFSGLMLPFDNQKRNAIWIKV